VLAVLLLTWFWSSQEPAEESVTAAPVPAVVEPVVVPAPDIPVRPVPEPLPEPTPEVEPIAEDIEPAEPVLPSQAESNDLMRSEMDAAGADARLNALVGAEHPLEISSALIDGMSRGIILRKILPADPPRQAFSVIAEDDVIYMSSAS
jgi:hypothetical protein